jgi:hypothetical protein
VAALTARPPVMTQVFQTRDQRPVRRRLAQLKERAAAVGILPWGTAVEAQLPKRIWRVGRVRLPSTTNALERFVRALPRFYPTRRGVHSILSATRALRRFGGVYLCTPQASPGQAPIAVLVPAARRMPLYRLINDPFSALPERRHGTSTASMAAVPVGEAAAAERRRGGSRQRSPQQHDKGVIDSLDKYFCAAEPP